MITGQMLLAALVSEMLYSSGLLIQFASCVHLFSNVLALLRLANLVIVDRRGTLLYVNHTVKKRIEPCMILRTGSPTSVYRKTILLTNRKKFVAICIKILLLLFYLI